MGTYVFFFFGKQDCKYIKQRNKEHHASETYTGMGKEDSVQLKIVLDCLICFPPNPNKKTRRETFPT